MPKKKLTAEKLDAEVNSNENVEEFSQDGDEFIEVELDEITFALESSSNCFVNVKTGEVVETPEGIEEFDDEGHFAELREKVESDKTYVQIDPFPAEVAFGIMEKFVEQMSESKAKDRLEDAIHGSRPFRRFKDVLNEYLDLRNKWFEFKDEEMIYWSRWWLHKNGVEAKITTFRRDLRLEQRQNEKAKKEQK